MTTKQLRQGIAIHMAHNNPSFDPSPGTADEEDLDAIMSAVKDHDRYVIGSDRPENTITNDGHAQGFVYGYNSRGAEQRKRAGIEERIEK